MVNGLFSEISEEEMLSVNGACGGGVNPYAAPQPCEECKNKGAEYVKEVVVNTTIGYITGGPTGAATAFLTTVIKEVPEPHEQHPTNK